MVAKEQPEVFDRGTKPLPSPASNREQTYFLPTRSTAALSERKV